MLTEHFITSIGSIVRPSGTNATKDAAIHIHEFQPLLAQRTVYKKSATPPNCLALSSTHVFAAQSEKAVVHVYSQAKGNQEAIVPFHERINALTLACDETILVLGTAEGRVFLWELASGRLVVTAQSHLQAVNALAVDPTQNFLLSASKDSTVHIWSLPELLSFANTEVRNLSPLRTFPYHRAELVDIVLGHSSSFCNIAITASKDKTCLVWDYHTNDTLRTYLLPAVPTCLALDAGDRAFYVGHDDGSIQQIDLYQPLTNIRDEQYSTAPLQPPSSSTWMHPDRALDPVLSITVSFDGYTILSGHESGTIVKWTAGNEPTTLLQMPLSGPVTNVSFMPVTGFQKDQEGKVMVHGVVKPKIGAFDDSSGTVPGNYSLNCQLVPGLTGERLSDFERALAAPAFPTEMLDEGLEELLGWGKRVHSANGGLQAEPEDFMALDDQESKPKQLSLDEQNLALKQELEALRRVQKASFEKMQKLNTERQAFVKREQHRLANKGVNGVAGQTNGAEGADVDISGSSSHSDDD